MNAPQLFLFASLVGAGFTLSALLRGKRPAALSAPYFLGAWLTGELAHVHLAWQAVATGIFVALGALASWHGWLALGITLVSWLGLIHIHRRTGSAAEVLERALREALGEDYLEGVAPERSRGLFDPIRPGELARPFRMKVPGVVRVRDLPYGEAGMRNLLDVYHPDASSDPSLEGHRPVLLQIHGGAWTIGNKQQQALPLIYRLASRGWVCVSINYRLSPAARFPDHIVDVKRALAWIREHIAEYGGDPSFVAVTGGSAGGHLSSLAALTPNDPELQPGFEGADTSVQAAVPFYGVYDFLDRHGVRGKAAMTPWLARTVMPCTPDYDAKLWEKASPIAQVRPDAPPFFVIHGSHDSLAWVEDARHFAQALREVSRRPVAYAEIPHAQHAFETFHSVRSRAAVNASIRFLETIWARHRAAGSTA